MSNINPSFTGQNDLAGATDALFLKVFSNEVLNAYERATAASQRTRVRRIANGKSAKFPVTGRAAAAYHTPGNQLTGSGIPMSERVITIDDLLVSHVYIAEIDEAKDEFEVRSEYAKQLGESLAVVRDSNILQVAIQAARSANVIASLPGGSSLINANFKVDSTVLANGLFLASQTLDEKFVPEMGRYAYMKPAQYNLLAQSTTAINTLFGGNGSYSEGKIVRIANIELVKALFLPTTNVVGGQYAVDATNTAAVIMHSDAVGTVELIGMKTGMEWSEQHLATLMTARYAIGHGKLKVEAAVELKTA